MKDRRLKFVHIDEDELIDAFTRINAPHFVAIRNRKLPEGYNVLSVHHDAMRRCWQVLISHPSFEEVPSGQDIPDFEGPSCFVCEVVKVKRDDDYSMWSEAAKLAKLTEDQTVAFREFL